MSAHCCGHTATFDGLSADYRRRLWAVIAINAAMFLIEMAAGALDFAANADPAAVVAGAAHRRGRGRGGARPRALD